MAFLLSGLTNLTVPDSADSTFIYSSWTVALDTPWFDAQQDGPVYFGKILIFIKGEIPDDTFIDYIRDDTVVIGNAAISRDHPGIIGFIIPSSVKYIWHSNFQSIGAASMILPSTVEYLPSTTFGMTTRTVYTDADAVRPLWFFDNKHYNYIRFANNACIFYGCTLSDDKSYVVSIVKNDEKFQKHPYLFSGCADAPLRKDYIFVGWATTPNGNAEYTMGSLDDAPDGVLYAVWEKAD